MSIDVLSIGINLTTLLAYSIEHIRMNYLISGVSPNRVVNNHFQLVVRAETDEQKNFLSSKITLNNLKHL